VGKTARQLGLPVNEIEAHIASSSFLNAALVLRLLANAHPRVCEEMQDAISSLENGQITIVMGGKESISAEARAATLAEKTNAKCILLTENEIPTNTLSHSKFAKMANEAAQEGDASFIVDPFTSLILARGKIETLLVWGKHINQLPNAIEGNDFDGTRITSEKDALPEMRVKKRFSKNEFEE
jgi:uridylate kinase